MSNHPDHDQLAAFLEGRLSEQERLQVEQHVESCDVCCSVLSQAPEDSLAARIRGVGTGVDDDTIIDEKSQQRPSDQPDVPAALVDHPRYRILEPLGRGGMGVVYKAQHRMMDRVVALKVINGQLIENHQAIERFRNEVKAAARLTHANIVRAYDAEQAGDLHFLVMEFVDGISLAELVRRKGPLPIEQACGVVRKVAHGLHHAFQQGMVHRDIKPQNIMVTQSGKVRILDFGLARLVRERDVPVGTAVENPMDQMRRTADALTFVGTLLGTPDYIAPEQVMDAHLADTRADIYSLGCTFYFLLTGHPPYPGGTAMEKLVSHTDGAAPPVVDERPDVPAGVAEIVSRMMARQPQDRFQEPLDIARAIDAALKEPVTATTATTQMGSPTEATIAVPTEVPRTRSAPIPNPLLQQQSVDSAVSDVSGELSSADHDSSAHAKSGGLKIERNGQQSESGAKSRLLMYVVPLLGLAALAGVVVPMLSGPGGTRTEVVDLPLQTATDAAVESGWTDLLSQVVPETAVEQGVWQRTGGELHVRAGAWARLVLPGEVPAEYDLEVIFTRVTGQHSVALMFVTGGNQATFELDAWAQHLAGIQNIDGQDLKVNPSRVEGQALTNGRRYTARVQVRVNRVEAFLDGQLLATYVGDGSDLSPLPEWRLGDGRRLGIGAYESDAVFHAIRLRPVTQLP